MLGEWSTRALLQELEVRGNHRRLNDAPGGAELADYSRQMRETLPLEALDEMPFATPMFSATTESFGFSAGTTLGSTVHYEYGMDT